MEVSLHATTPPSIGGDGHDPPSGTEATIVPLGARVPFVDLGPSNESVWSNQK